VPWRYSLILLTIRIDQALGMASPSLNIGRHSLVGAVYMVTTVTVLRRPVFAVEAAAQAMASALRASDASGETGSIAWVAMPDHLHWLFELRADTLSGVVQRLKSRSARQVNASCGVHGALWQPGFHDHQVRRHEDLAGHARYLLGNPVRRGLSERVGEYPHAWCKYGNDLWRGACSAGLHRGSPKSSRVPKGDCHKLGSTRQRCRGSLRPAAHAGASRAGRQ
jgi:putative transposase